MNAKSGVRYIKEMIHNIQRLKILGGDLVSFSRRFANLPNNNLN